MVDSINSVENVPIQEHALLQYVTYNQDNRGISVPVSVNYYKVF